MRTTSVRRASTHFISSSDPSSSPTTGPATVINRRSIEDPRIAFSLRLSLSSTLFAGGPPSPGSINPASSGVTKRTPTRTPTERTSLVGKLPKVSLDAEGPEVFKRTSSTSSDPGHPSIDVPSMATSSILVSRRTSSAPKGGIGPSFVIALTEVVVRDRTRAEVLRAVFDQQPALTGPITVSGTLLITSTTDGRTEPTACSASADSPRPLGVSSSTSDHGIRGSPISSPQELKPSKPDGEPRELRTLAGATELTAWSREPTDC